MRPIASRQRVRMTMRRRTCRRRDPRSTTRLSTTGLSTAPRLFEQEQSVRPLVRSIRMATIVVFGGTGYTGGNIVREGASRGHQVISVSRSEPKEPVEGVRYELGSVDVIGPRVVPGADAVVAALSPRGDLAAHLVDVYTELARLSADAGARYLQVGGSSSLRPARGRERFVEPPLAEEFRDEALEGE